MYALSAEDVRSLTESSQNFKVIVPFAVLKPMCDDEILGELFDKMIDYALRYTESVCRWQRMAVENPGVFDDQGTRQAIEDTRKTVHTAFISQVNILSRTMIRRGRSVEWRNKIGEERSALGRFALVISFEYIKSLNEKGGVQ